MKSIYQYLITKVLAWLHGLTSADFENAKNYVAHAEDMFTTAAEKWTWVKLQLQALLPKLSATAINLLIELAVSYLKKKA